MVFLNVVSVVAPDGDGELSLLGDELCQRIEESFSSADLVGSGGSGSGGHGDVLVQGGLLDLDEVLEVEHYLVLRRVDIGDLLDVGQDDISSLSGLSLGLSDVQETVFVDFDLDLFVLLEELDQSDVPVSFDREHLSGRSDWLWLVGELLERAVFGQPSIESEEDVVLLDSSFRHAVQVGRNSPTSEAWLSPALLDDDLSSPVDPDVDLSVLVQPAEQGNEPLCFVIELRIVVLGVDVDPEALDLRVALDGLGAEVEDALLSGVVLVELKSEASSAADDWSWVLDDLDVSAEQDSHDAPSSLEQPLSESDEPLVWFLEGLEGAEVDVESELLELLLNKVFESADSVELVTLCFGGSAGDDHVGAGG